MKQLIKKITPFTTILTVVAYLFFGVFGNSSVLGEGTSAADEPSRTITETDYGFCRTLTAAAGFSTGIGTTTTGLFPLIATSTVSTLAATSSAGKVETLDSANNYPLDVVFVDEASCYAGSSVTAIPHYFEKYASTTGQFVVHMGTSNISSTTNKTVSMYYGKPSVTTDLNSPGQTYATSSPLNILGYWDLSVPGTATTTFPDFTDSTYNNNHASTSNMNNADLVTAQVDGGLELNGTNNVISVNDADSIDVGSGSFTALIWFNTSATSGTSAGRDDVIAKGDPGISGWSLGMQSNQLRATALTTILTTSPTTYNDGAWHQGVLRRSGSGLSLIVDNILKASGTKAGDLNTNTSLIFGRHGAKVESFFPGKLDGVRLYGSALTNSDISTIFNMESNSSTFWTFGAEETPPSSPPSPISPPPSARAIRIFGGLRLLGGLIFR